MMMGTRNRSPFSASQWQELEHQALIFKYMVSGMPIPPDLIFTIKRSLDSSISSRLFHHQPLGWGCFQMGFGRKADPEPGRCRRTDGKKWRCSKEAFPDSKYCERHMHRGRNRSRKPVEVITKNPPTSLISSITSSPSATTTPANIAPFSLSSLSSSRPIDTQYYTNPLHPFPYPHSPSSRAPAIGSPPQNNTTNLFLDSGSYSQSDKDYRNRYFHGQREEVDEHAFFSEVSGSLKHTSCSAWESEYSRLQLQRLADISKQQQQQQQQERHCFVLGTDFKSDRPVKVEKEPQKHLLHFFDELPPKNRESWLPLEGDRSNCSSTTQLSMSIPRSPRHLPISNSRTQKEY